MPNTNIDNTSGGTRQATTVHIILSTDSLLRTCGDTDTFHMAAAAGAWFSVTFGSMTILLAPLINHSRWLRALSLHLRQSDKLHKRTFGRAHIGRASAFKTFENAKLLGILSPVGLYIDTNFLGLQPHGTGFQAPAAADAV